MLTRLRVFTLLTLIIAAGALALLFAAAVHVRAQEDGGVTVTLDADQPVIEHGAQDAWDGRFTDPGAITFYDGQFHMFRNGFAQWPGWVGIAYHTSPDGVTWTQQGDGPVLTTDDVPFADVAALASSVYVDADGTWVLYVYTWGNQFSSAPESWAIGRATAPDPLGPWTVDPAPVLMPGSEGSWDAAQVGTPSVVPITDGYGLFYTGVDAGGMRMVGMAVSYDGIDWVKNDDPSTISDLFAESDPIMKPGEEGAWDAAYIHQPRVTVTPQGLVMSYRSSSPGGVDKAYGLALSLDDGYTWVRYGDNPVLFDKDIQRRGMWFNALLYHDGQYFMPVELQRGYQNQTDIYMATLEGDPFQ